MDEKVTVQNLQAQIAAQDAELQRVRNELARVGQELVREVAERSQTEETARSAKPVLEALAAECSIKDRDGFYRHINRAFERQFGVERADVIGQDDAYGFGDENAQH